jgi:uncharacterized protein YuzE
MYIRYNDKTGLLCIRLDGAKEEIVSRRISEDIVLDAGEGDKIIGVEATNASLHINQKRLLPIRCDVSRASV